ncbi:MAG TPA: diacylglycerol kinase family protein [Roseomonas sp.]|jgi:diacylglycerol kinase family enzyme
MRVALVLNPASGTLSAMAAPALVLARALEGAGFTLALPPAGALSLDAQLDAAIAAGPEAIFIAGGDGSIAAVAGRLTGTGIALGILPGGTMNRVAARLGLPATPEAAIVALAAPRLGGLPVAEADGRPFLYQSIIGPPARLVRFREMQRGAGLLGWRPLILAALRALLRPRSGGLRLAAPGHRRLRASVAVVSTPETADGAALRVEAVTRHTAWSRLRQLLRWTRGALGADPGVVSFTAPHLVVGGRGKWLRLTLDGELVLLRAPIRIRLRQEALKVLLPAR